MPEAFSLCFTDNSGSWRLVALHQHVSRLQTCYAGQLLHWRQRCAALSPRRRARGMHRSRRHRHAARKRR
jgi:hypothetical protein